MPTTAIREAIGGKIFHFRGHKVMADRDLAQLYGVPTKALNQAVKRNKRRFPADFMFTLSKKEAAQLVTNCDRFMTLKHSPGERDLFCPSICSSLNQIINEIK